jgi:hypothetical protein
VAEKVSAAFEEATGRNAPESDVTSLADSR